MSKLIKYSKVPLNLVGIDTDGFHVFVEARINRKKACVLLDTGASKTVFDSQRFKKFMCEDDADVEKNFQFAIGIGAKKIKSHFAIIRNMKLGNITISDYPVALIDLTHINESYKSLGLRPIDGVFGGDLFVAAKAQINYLSRTLKIFDMDYR